MTQTNDAYSFLNKTASVVSVPLRRNASEQLKFQTFVLTQERKMMAQELRE